MTENARQQAASEELDLARLQKFREELAGAAELFEAIRRALS